jgi:hypothetical protein
VRELGLDQAEELVAVLDAIAARKKTPGWLRCGIGWGFPRD